MYLEQLGWAGMTLQERTFHDEFSYNKPPEKRFIS